MKKLLLVLSVIVSFTVNAQTVTFNGCHTLFENQDYVFNLETTDASGRNVYSTTPVDGNQTCGGLGTCEFKILWSTSNSRWELIADSGNGDFVNPYLIYYNTSASIPNPPDLTLGTWVENTADTNSDCGGNLTTGNASLSGSVQSTVLGVDSFSGSIRSVVLYPNPAEDMITLVTKEPLDSFSVFTMLGQMVMNVKNSNIANITLLQKGVYFIRLNTNEGVQVLNFIKK